MTDQSMSSLGEKAFIREFIKPFFNGENDPYGVGDDCAMIPFGDSIILLSTDRVPSDLVAFRAGILDFFALGGYLARLNLSDIAACGGEAIALLLNLGLPENMGNADAEKICRGFRAAANKHGAKVLGGDVTSAAELSISATSVGSVSINGVLRRSGAKEGDSIFLSRPPGLTPAAFRVLNSGHEARFSEETISSLWRQFTSMEPMLALGKLLGQSGKCGACMDNTDGLGQSFQELSEASGIAFVVEQSKIILPSTVRKVAEELGLEPHHFIYDGGADFSLIGTLDGSWTSEEASIQFKHPLAIIGHVEKGKGVWMSANVGIIAAMQSEVSVDPSVSERKRRVLTLNMRTRFIFRAADMEGATASADFIGKRQFWKQTRISKPFQAGTVSRTKQEEHYIKTSDLMRLKDHVAVIVHPSKRFIRKMVTPCDGSGITLRWH